MNLNKSLLSKIHAAALKDGPPQDTVISSTREVNGRMFVDMTISRPLETGPAVLPIGYITAYLNPEDAQDADAEFELGRFHAKH